MARVTRLDEIDNVAVTFASLPAGTEVETSNSIPFATVDEIPVGHKLALEEIAAGEPVIKYGSSIGIATQDIARGALVHSHNIRTGLSDKQEYQYSPVITSPERFVWENPIPLEIYRRSNGKVGIRNEIWVVPTVGCVNGVAESLIREFAATGDRSGVDGIYCFPHPYGCSQLGGDHERTKMTLQNIALHPNAGAVLVLGLGCENNQISAFRESMPEPIDPERIRFLAAQDVSDEIESGLEQLEQLYAIASQDERETGSWSDIVIGLECGGSDAFSGITANPLIGRVSDYVIGQGGTTVLTEVPEMFGAEHILMERCESREVFNKTVELINGFKEYYMAHNQPIYENPSPGNKAGGITTLEDKSLGCTRKAGRSSVVDVIDIDQRISRKGLNLLNAPGNDIVATTSLGSVGCQLVLFSTGRGTPLGGFVPTVKIATNSALAKKKANWIDFDAGLLADPDHDPDNVLSDFLTNIATTINGRPTSAEVRNNREIAIFKTGVTL
jgi:altronate hydrolase